MSTSPSSSGKNRRRDPRRPVRSSVRVECRQGTLGMGPNLTRAVLDLSQSGVRLSLTATLAAGSEAELLISTHGSRPIKRLATVSWARDADANGHQVGLLFQSPLSFRELQNLAKP